MYTPFANFSLDTIALSRRDFLHSCTVLGVCLSGCESFFQGTKFAEAMINVPPPDIYHPILLDLIKTILPFEHPQFPSLPPESVEERLISYFPIDSESRFVPLQKSLVFFNETTLFPQTFPPIEAEEKKDDSGSDINAKSNHDKKLYSRYQTDFGTDEKQFTSLGVKTKRSYLWLWGQSGFRIKRQFYHSIKSLVMITAYSTDELWKAIDYEGPLLTKK